MILGPDRQKLSKRHGARAVIEYEQDGLLPQALVNYLVRLGWSHGDQEIFSMDELVHLFDGTSLNSAAAAFDPEKLQWLNAHYLRETPPARIAEMVEPFMEKKGVSLDRGMLEKLVPLYRERSANLVELAEDMALYQPGADVECEEKAAKSLTDEGKGHIAALRGIFAGLAEFDEASLEAAIHEYVEKGGLKFKQVGPPLRAALIGRAGGPSVHLTLCALGREESLRRLDRVLA